MTRGSVLITILGVLLGARIALAQGSIELRTSARLDPERPLTLGDVAILKGPDAEGLADVVVLPAGGRVGAPSHDANGSPVTLSLESVRQAIDQDRHVNWGRLLLRGSRCAVLPPIDSAPRPETTKKTRPESDGRVVPGTVRSAVLARIVQLSGAEPEALRLAFDARDAEVLDTSVAGRSVEVNPAGTSDKVPLAIRVVEGERTLVERTIRVGVQVRRSVLTSRSVRRKGDTIAEGDVEAGEQWLPLTARPASSEQVLGSSVQSRLNAGEIIMENDVSAPLAAQKGEVVAVRVLSGSVALATKARAMGPAREGELVRLQALDTKREFLARMDGRGRALIVAGQTPADAPDASGSVPNTPESRRARKKEAIR